MVSKITLKFLSALIFFSVLLFCVVGAVNAEQGSYLDSNFIGKRRQTSQTNGLIPFPRVGRASKGKSWQLRDSEQTKRREGLIPFPRVGRSGRQPAGKLLDNIPLTWFAARAHRDFQRIYPDLEDQWIASAFQNYKLVNDANEEDEYFSKSNQNQLNDELAYSDDGRKENLELL